MNDNLRTWMELADEPDIQLTEYDISANPNDFNVITITNFLEAGSIILPPYQRNYTWEKARASKLIESLVLGLPVPQLFLYEEAKNRFAILDGQQRLLSVYFFRKKRFPRKNQRSFLREVFDEKGGFPDGILSDDKYFEPFNIHLPAVGGEDKSSLHGLNYDTLADLQPTFNLRTIRCVIIKQNEPKDDNSSVYEIFDRLNTGGVNLKPQEIRANLYYSEFYKLLYEVNKDRRWRDILGEPNRDEKLRDVELLLRAFAMLCYADEYRPSMTRFLNRFSNHAKKHLSSDDVAYLQNLFDKFLDAASRVDAASFRLADRFSIAVFEAAFYGRCKTLWVARREPVVIDALTKNVMEALTGELRASLQEGTSKREHVQSRLTIATRILGPQASNV
jgi:Protein of unknown function DUF262